MPAPRSFLLLLLILTLPTTGVSQDLPSVKLAEEWNKPCEDSIRSGQYAVALPVCRKAVEALEKLAPEQRILAEAYTNLGWLYGLQGNYFEIEPLFLSSLRIAENVLGPQHPDVAVVRNNLAMLYYSQGDYPKAEQFHKSSLLIKEQTLGPNHPDVAESLSNLGVLYTEQGEYQKAEELLLRSLRIRENALGREHPDVAMVLNNLSRPYHARGEYKKVEELLLRGLRIWEKTLPPEHPNIAKIMGNLAELYRAQGKDQKAEELLLRSWHMAEKALGPDHPDVALRLNSLSKLYHSQGDDRKAELQQLRSLQILEKALGLEHPNVADSLNDLALLYYYQGEYQKAEPLYLRSLRIREKALGSEHPSVAESLHNLALLDLALNHPDLGLPRFARALAIRERVLRNAVTEARISSVLEIMRDQEDAIYSLTLFPNATEQMHSLALSVSLLRKGRAAEAGLMTGRALLNNLSTKEQRQRFQAWQTLRTQRETMVLHGAGKLELATHEANLAALQNQIDGQEQELVRAAPELAAWKLPAPEEMISQVAAKLPKDSALIEVLLIKPRQFQAKGKEPQWGEPRYLALLLFPDQRIESLDLGPAQSLDAAASAFLQASRISTSDPLPTAQALYQRVFAPLAAKLQGARKLYLSLDGSLNLVPFAALHDGHKYLLDSRYQLVYVSSGRDPLRGSMGQAVQPPLVLADPDYGSGVTVAQAGEKRTVDGNTRGLYEELTSLQQLKGTRVEGVMLGRLLGVKPLMGAAATEAAVRAAKSPVVLHIATHGLVLDEEATGQGRSVATMQRPSLPDLGTPQVGRSKDLSLSRSALMLAGAAHAADAVDSAHDGVLTAEEARSLNLCGTQLVVLSACNSGLGSVKAGQGVYGLRRAFYVAGAETVVMSLWEVADSETESLMERYYRLLLDKKQPRGRVSGLSEAMKAVKAEREHPYYWAPFIALGSDAPLTLH